MCDELFWILYSNGSKPNDGARDGCILIDPNGEKTMLSCRLEFGCTNNSVEYEALVQGSQKAINLDVNYLKVYGDSEIVIKHVRNIIHCVFNHLINP